MYGTMNTIYRPLTAEKAIRLPIFILVLLWSLTAWADSRQEALAELEHLHSSATTTVITDELKSVEATFAVAEHYFQSNDLEQAERFYLLTVQKARIVQASIAKASHPAEPALETVLPEQSPGTTPGILPQTSVSPAEVIEQQPPPVTTEPTHPAIVQETDPTPRETLVESDVEIISDMLVGAASTYTVVSGDTIRLVAAKLGVSRQHLIRRNSIDEKAYLKIGQKLAYNNRKIIPQKIKNGIIVNIPDRTLYLFRQGKVAASLPVAVGVATKTEKYDWQTPTGKFKITAKMKDPTWHVPPSIQSEMEEHGKEVVTSVPPGEKNPLGKYAIKTSIPGILIHSTTKPWSIYSFASHGCIRVYPEQMEEFFKEVKVNTYGEIIYKPVKLAVTEEGRVFLEVHRDVYKKTTNLASEAKRMIEKQNLSGRVDWKKVEAILLRKTGIAEDITL